MTSEEKYMISKKSAMKDIPSKLGSVNVLAWEFIWRCKIAKIKKSDLIKLLIEDADPIKIDSNRTLIDHIYKMKEYHGQSNTNRIEEYLKSKYDFRYNLVRNRTEYRLKGEEDFNLIRTYDINSMLRELKLASVPVHQTFLPVIINSSFATPYNPFLEYFESLPPWDGIDYIGFLTETVKTDNDDLWHMAFKKWLVAVVASAVNDEIINHTLIVMTGEQGLGKTTWMEKLVPQELKRYYYSGTIDPANKDHLTLLSECFMINLDELENLSRTEIGTLKQLITQTRIKLRKPYAYYDEEFPRRASFMGSVNIQEFLHDPTGSRRFLAFEANHIDYQHTLDISKVYSQAYHLFKAGFQFFFDKKETALITVHNEKFQFMAMEEELLKEYFEPCEKEKADKFMNASNVLQALAEFEPNFKYNNGHKINMGKILKSQGFVRTKKGGIYVYALKEKIIPISASKPGGKQEYEIVPSSAYENFLKELDHNEIQKRSDVFYPIVYQQFKPIATQKSTYILTFEEVCEKIEGILKKALDDYDRGILLSILRTERMLLDENGMKSKVLTKEPETKDLMDIFQ